MPLNAYDIFCIKMSIFFKKAFSAWFLSCTLFLWRKERRVVSIGGKSSNCEQKRMAKVCFFDKEGEFPIKPWLIGSRFLIQETVSFQQGRISSRASGEMGLWPFEAILHLNWFTDQLHCLQIELIWFASYRSVFLVRGIQGEVERVEKAFWTQFSI